MSNKDSENVQRIRDELTKVASMLLAARQNLANGTPFDFGAISGRIGLIGRSIEKMPYAVGDTLFGDLQALVSQLEALENTMRECLRPASPPEA